MVSGRTAQGPPRELDYIHHNPISGKWNLAESFIEYPYSSASFYEKNLKHPYVDILHYLDIDG